MTAKVIFKIAQCSVFATYSPLPPPPLFLSSTTPSSASHPSIARARVACEKGSNAKNHSRDVFIPRERYTECFLHMQNKHTQNPKKLSSEREKNIFTSQKHSMRNHSGVIPASMELFPACITGLWSWYRESPFVLYPCHLFTTDDNIKAKDSRGVAVGVCYLFGIFCYCCCCCRCLQVFVCLFVFCLFDWLVGWLVVLFLLLFSFCCLVPAVGNRGRRNQSPIWWEHRA